ncbi:unnamed protein product [Nezara viridula]|uniref:Carboxylesterase type B domain-containing protein n=1 Tax=Nezara viridula TaxID=85310 RepID=A0A9P0HUS5_NEZVI|nr:unnamed protein product [Nezara viridula]
MVPVSSVGYPSYWEGRFPEDRIRLAPRSRRHSPGARVDQGEYRILRSRAILISGSLLSPWGTGQDPGGLRARLAAAAGCRTEPLACLKALPPLALTSLTVQAPRFLTAVGPWVHGEPASAVEVAGDPFLSSRLMIGTTTTESFLDFNSHEIQTYVRNAYDYHLNEIFSTVRNEYTDWEKPIQHPINIRDSTLEALSDGHTVAPLLRLGYLHARRGSPTYFYHFSHHSKESSYPEVSPPI